MNAKHTPGPWIVHQGFGAYFVTAPSETDPSSPHRTTIATFNENQHGAFFTQRAKADAELFASIPNLLAERDALRESLQIIADGLHKWRDSASGRINEPIRLQIQTYEDIARAALAKAQK